MSRRSSFGGSRSTATSGRHFRIGPVVSTELGGYRVALLANLRAAYRDGERPALRPTSYFCRYGRSSRRPRCAISCWSSELGTRRMDLGLRERRVAIAPTVRGGGSSRGSSSARKVRLLFTPLIDLADSRNWSPPEQVNSAGRFPRDRDPEYPRHPVGVSRRARPIGSRRTGRFHRRFSRWEGPQMLTRTYLEGCQWVREPLFRPPSVSVVGTNAMSAPILMMRNTLRAETARCTEDLSDGFASFVAIGARDQRGTPTHPELLSVIPRAALSGLREIRVPRCSL